ncbi:aminotransferase class IV [Fulvimarina sp. 2208YS6-2-32]|uniref:Probable branched-chain-amino-acid aminotransferase n=1 Tax=Fulvimarina uroteuthidis TaxID=3098149 RepID=A0ABU5I860_9HYPH|nr:aminotransferase class IV [Fulvimarina sp. 2208YS6-2-32]MDY8111008.1 aminotransferase class IV [Fulvimarina sp. 2208YS6-2-32]
MNARAWVNDRLVSADEARIDPADRGFTLADGCFDTALALNGIVFRADRHLDRLAATCGALSLPMPRERLARAQAALAGEIGHGSIRLTVTRGTGARGLALPADPQPTLLGIATPLAPHLMFRPMRLAFAEARRNDRSPLSRLKTLSYLDAILETRRAVGIGADEPVFLNTRGRVACSALANIFLVDDHEFVTPPLDEGVLDGVMRGELIETIGCLGATARIAPIPFDKARSGRFLLTNSLRIIAPARLVDGPAFDRTQGAFILELMGQAADAIARTCGADPRDLGAAFPTLDRLVA